MKNVVFYLKDSSKALIELAMQDLNHESNVMFVNDINTLFELAFAGKIDRLVLGQVTPDYKPGDELAREIKETSRKIQISFISSHLPALQTAQMLREGIICGYYDKGQGIDPEHMTSWLASILEANHG